MFFTSFYLYILVKCLILFSHPVHVSVTNVDYMPDEHKTEIAFKAFKQDMQLLFVHLNQINIDFEDLESIKSNQTRINKYFSNHFKMNTGSDFTMNFKESKLDNEWVWFYYEAETGEITNEIEITNTILLDLNLNQKNMLIFCYEEKEKGFMFNLQKTKQQINLNEL